MGGDSQAPGWEHSSVQGSATAPMRRSNAAPLARDAAQNVKVPGNVEPKVYESHEGSSNIRYHIRVAGAGSRAEGTTLTMRRVAGIAQCPDGAVRAAARPRPSEDAGSIRSRAMDPDGIP